MESIELTEAENELYDRQIRLWGLESQKRLRTAKVLICGLGGIGAEITKNIILSGIHSVVLNDNKTVTEIDFSSQFLIPRSELGKNRAESSIERASALNPMVEISADSEPLSKKNENFFIQFDVVVITEASNDELLRIDEICRKHNVKLFAADVWGMFGFAFADLQNHAFVEDTIKHKIVTLPNGKTKSELVTSTVHREIKYSPYSAVIGYDFKSTHFEKKIRRTGPAFLLLRVLQSFRETFERDPSHKTRNDDVIKLKHIRNEISNEEMLPDQYFINVFGQISPSVAVVGGVVSQEVIKVISKKEAPHSNVFLFDPSSYCGFIETIGMST